MCRLLLRVLAVITIGCAGPAREQPRDDAVPKAQTTGKPTGAAAPADRQAGRDFTVVFAEVRRGPLKIVFLTAKGDGGVAASSTANEGNAFVAVRVTNSSTLSYKLSEIGISPAGRIEAISNPEHPVLVHVDPAVTSVKELTACDWLLVVEERHLDALSLSFRGQEYRLSVRR